MRIPRLIPLAALAALLLFLPACDTVADLGNENVILTRDVTFSFDFMVDTPQAALRATSTNQVDLSGQLEGFTKAEILSATVTSARLTRVQPVRADLAELMDAVLLELTASGGSATTVAQQAGLPASAEGALTVSGSPGVTSHVKAPSFGAALTFTNLAVPALGIYRFEVTVRLRIEVEGV